MAKIKVWTVREYARRVQFEHEGLKLSLSLGEGSYSDGRVGKAENSTMEITLIGEDGEFISMENDDVLGYVPVNKLPALLTVLFSNHLYLNRVNEIKEILFP